MGRSITGFTSREFRDSRIRASRLFVQKQHQVAITSWVGPRIDGWEMGEGAEVCSVGWLVNDADPIFGQS